MAFHVLTDGRNGVIRAQNVAILIDNLNWAFRDTPFSFYLARLDTTKNKAWYENCVFNAKNMQKIRKRLARDTRSHLNVYTCKLGSPGVLGIATFPFPFPGAPTGYLQGVAVDPYALGSAEYPYGHVLAHEAGHYLGLYHTFENAGNPDLAGCADPGDFVDDTPTQAFPTFGACPVGLDSCPALAGADDIPNLMNYSTDECLDHFTPGQAARMVWAVELFRPLLGQ